ncbi:MAG TPA: DUF2066 domain-containing protein [Stellaceae bacterium]|nr:DUF2066 domain-containing protein [Stellaceae bacterium]
MTRGGLFLSFAAASAAAFLSFAAVAAEGDDVFAVSVPVDATADSASAARDAARLDGERRAYAALLDRITLASDRAKLAAPSDADLNTVIQGFEVANERRSTVRYLADYTFHFSANAVERRLRAAGVPFAVTRSRPVLVLAVLESGSGPVLWDDPNPWRDAWSAAKPPQGLVSLVLPLGEIEDVSAIDAAGADKGDDQKLQAISANYGHDDVLVTRATITAAGAGKTVSVSSTRFSPGSPGGEQSWAASYIANPGESDQDLLARAVAGTAAQVQEAWKKANIINYSQTGTLTVAVPTGDLQSWLAIRDRLAAIPAIQSTELLAIDRQRAVVTLHYAGDATQLKTALAQRNLDLSGADPDWILRRGGAPQSGGPAPATPAQ